MLPILVIRNGTMFHDNILTSLPQSIYILQNPSNERACGQLGATPSVGPGDFKSSQRMNCEL